MASIVDLPITALGELRTRLNAPVQRLISTGRLPHEQYSGPAGDPGLFGPESVTWRVHADPSMLVGGLAALMLQTLHPLAMAGVAEHSDYRDDPLGRLSRTASFVTATTYGSTATAERMIAAVRRIHERVTGTAPDGRPYAAGDSALLTWVHVAEAANFLRAHQRYVPFPVRDADADRYFAEMAVIPERLGAAAADVPRSRDQVRAYVRAMRESGELVAGEQALDAVRFVTTPPLRTLNPVVAVAQRVVIGAAVGLLPGWAVEMLHLRRPPSVLHWTVVRPAAAALLQAMRLTGGTPPPLTEARRRCA